MKKNIIRLNESQLKNIIRESVKRVLREENDDDTSFWRDTTPEEKQAQIDADWNDIEAADEDFKNDDLYKNMKDFDHKYNYNVYPNGSTYPSHFGLEAQDPSSEGNFARYSDLFTSLPNDSTNFHGQDYNYKEHNIQDAFYNRPD